MLYCATREQSSDQSSNHQQRPVLALFSTVVSGQLKIEVELPFRKRMGKENSFPLLFLCLVDLFSVLHLNTVYSSHFLTIQYLMCFSVLCLQKEFFSFILYWIQIWFKIKKRGLHEKALWAVWWNMWGLHHPPQSLWKWERKREGGKEN